MRYRNLASEQQRRSIVRATANGYQRRGKITRQPCALCRAQAHKHHHDYRKPLDVSWLCQPCHKIWHMWLSRMFPGKHRGAET